MVGVGGGEELQRNKGLFKGRENYQNDFTEGNSGNTKGNNTKSQKERLNAITGGNSKLTDLRDT